MVVPAALILRHLRTHPEVPDVYTTTEAAEAAARHELPGVVDTGISNSELADLVGDELSPASAGEILEANVPALTLVVAGLELARNLRKGMSWEEAGRIASRRTGVALTYASLAWLAAWVSGVEGVRFGVIAVGEGSRYVVHRLSRELEPSIAHVREQQQALASLQARLQPAPAL